MAQGWLEKREAELAKPGGLAAAQIGKATLGDAIDRFRLNPIHLELGLNT